MREILKILEEPLVVFFLWMAVLYLISNVFLTKRFSFWLSAVLTTLFWLKMGKEPLTLLQAWGIIFVVFLVVYISNALFHIPPFTILTGKKLCNMCYMEIPRKAKVCPYCHHELSSDS
ncbi:hypothetical protein [Aquifex sp.]